MRVIETPSRIEPLFFEDSIPAGLADLTFELQREAGDLGRGLHPESAAELADIGSAYFRTCSRMLR